MVSSKGFTPTPERARASSEVRKAGARLVSGFTLVELIVVIAIIGVLAAIVTINLGGFQEDARYTRAESELAQISHGIKLLESDTGKHPGGGPAVCVEDNTPDLGGNNEIYLDDEDNCDSGLLCKDD